MRAPQRSGLLSLLLLASACAAPTVQPSSPAEPSSSAAPTFSAGLSIDHDPRQNGLLATFTIADAFRGLIVFHPVSGETRWRVPSDDFGSVAWSPDGTQLAVVRPSENGLTVYDATGAVIVSAPGAGSAAWSPDSEALVVTLIDGLAVLHAAAGADVDRIGPRWSVYESTWAPDGASVVFTSTGVDFDPANPPIGEPPRGLYRLALGDGSVTQLTESQMLDNEPFISPDGSRIAFKRYDAGAGSNQAFLTDEAGALVLLGRVGWAANPWSPDGTRLLLSGPDATWIAALDGEVIEVVAREHDTLAPIGMGWSPDGAFVLIAWQATLGDLITLEAVAVDGSERRDLGTGYGASWQPLR